MALVTLADGPRDGTSVRVESPTPGQVVPIDAIHWPDGAYVIAGKRPGYNAPVIAIWTDEHRREATIRS